MVFEHVGIHIDLAGIVTHKGLLVHGIPHLFVLSDFLYLCLKSESFVCGLPGSEIICLDKHKDPKISILK